MTTAMPVNRPLWKALISISLLLMVLGMTDLDALRLRFQAISSGPMKTETLGWLALAIIATVPQYLLSAGRWQLTARQLDLPLAYVPALKAYYKATFFNQVLPGGLFGDVGRAIDHGRQTSAAQRSLAWRAVAIERLAGQLVLILAVMLMLPYLGRTSSVGEGSASFANGWHGLFIIMVMSLLSAAYFNSRCRAFVKGIAAGIRIFFEDVHRAWLSPGLLTRQMLLSTAILASYLLSYVALAEVFAFDGDLLWLCGAILLVLLTMSLPVSIGGWGIREISAGSLWLAGGHDPAAGVAIAIAYGLLNLVCSLPGAWFALQPRRCHG